MQVFTFNIFRGTFVYLAFILSLFSCNKDQNLTRDYPRMNTVEVTDIKTTEALVHGEIISGDFSQVVQYGFTWNEYVDPEIDLHDHLVINETLKEKKFTGRIQSLKSDQLYYIRSFIKTHKLLIYGPVSSFKTSK